VSKGEPGERSFFITQDGFAVYPCGPGNGFLMPESLMKKKREMF
jgi:hypothetical protein